MNKIEKFIIEKLQVSADTVIKHTFSSKHREKHISTRSKINKFKKFFEDLIDMAGLRIAFSYPNKRESLIKLYKIRENEPDTALYNNDGAMRSYKCILETLFKETNWDWNDEDNLNMSYLLCLDGFDDDELRTLEKIGFKEEEVKVQKSQYDYVNKEFMTISIKDLYDNIDKIYKTFFE